MWIYTSTPPYVGQLYLTPKTKLLISKKSVIGGSDTNTDGQGERNCHISHEHISTELKQRYQYHIYFNKVRSREDIKTTFPSTDPWILRDF
jgi:hypothetical protein